MERARVDATNSLVKEYFEDIFEYKHREDFPERSVLSKQRKRAQSKRNSESNSKLEDGTRGDEDSKPIIKKSQEKNPTEDIGSFNGKFSKVGKNSQV